MLLYSTGTCTEICDTGYRRRRRCRSYRDNLWCKVNPPNQLEEECEFELKIKRFQKSMETEKRMRLIETEDVEEADVDGFQGPSGCQMDDDGDHDDVGNSAGFTGVQ
jgi:hypothetical protein